MKSALVVKKTGFGLNTIIALRGFEEATVELARATDTDLNVLYQHSLHLDTFTVVVECGTRTFSGTSKKFYEAFLQAEAQIKRFLNEARKTKKRSSRTKNR